MDQRWHRIRQIVEDAVDTPAQDRDGFVRNACGADRGLYDEVAGILEQYDGTSILDGSPYENLNGSGSQAPLTATACQDLARTLVDQRLKDRYRLEREIGRGGFGTVFLASDEHLLSKKVVIKVMLNPVLDAWSEKQFRAEVEALARLNHPGIVSVSDTGETLDGHLFIVMEHVDGVPLRALIKAGGIEIRQAGAVLRQVARALDAAHLNRVWHRDLKPENIMVHVLNDGEWNVKLIDFGIAAVNRDDTGAHNTSRVAGTIRYMAPEQLRGKTGAGNDIYALGVIAYEMVTGATPFNCDNAIDLFETQKSGVEVPPRSLRPDLSEAAEAAILKAIRFDDSSRYSTAAAFVRDFAADSSGFSRESPPVSASRMPSRRGMMRSAMVAGSGCLIAGSWFAFRRANSPATANSLVVLPFEDLNGGRDDEFLADAITDELIETLTRSKLKIVARTSAFLLKGTVFDPRQIGVRLGVDTLLTGTLRHNKGDIRISVQLVQARTGFGIWGRTFERRADQALGASEEISREVAQALQATLALPPNSGSVSERSRNWQAHNAYAQGRFFASRRTVVSLQTAIGYYESALKLNADYAPAYSGLADAYVYLGILQSSTTELVTRIKTLARRAAELDDSLAEPYTSLGQIAHYYDWDAGAAENNFHRALERDAASSDARRQYAGLLMNLRRTRESRSELDLALDFDPISVLLHLSRCFVDYLDGALDAAEQRVHRIMESDPGIPHVYQLAGILQLARGRNAEAVASFERSVDVSHGNLSFRAYYGYALATTGRKNEARTLLGKILDQARSEKVDQLDIATAYAGLNEDEKTLAHLEKAIEERSPNLVQLLIRPTWQRLRRHPRFSEIVHRVTLFRNA